MRATSHILVSALLWAVFGYYWYVVLGRDLNDTVTHALMILLALAVLGTLATLAWVIYNRRRVAKHERRRRQPASPSEEFWRDAAGRGVVRPDLTALQHAGVIEIGLDGDGHKVYRVREQAAL